MNEIEIDALLSAASEGEAAKIARGIWRRHQKRKLGQFPAPAVVWRKVHSGKPAHADDLGD